MKPTIKKIEQILEGAPEGSTHYDCDGDYWVMSDRLRAQFYDEEFGWEYAEPQEPVKDLSDLQTILDQHREIDRLRDFADKVANWQECTAEFRMNYGSNGERDYYRQLAREALTPPKGEGE